jgi:hypothetical protein
MRQVELLVSMHRPVPVIRDTVRPICIKKRVEITPEIIGGDCSPSAGSNQADPTPTEGIGGRKCNKISSSAGTRIILEQRLKLGFSVSPGFMAKYNKIKSLLSSRQRQAPTEIPGFPAQLPPHPPRRAGSGICKRQGQMHVYRREWETLQRCLGPGDRSYRARRAGRGQFARKSQITLPKA